MGVAVPFFGFGAVRARRTSAVLARRSNRVRFSDGSGGGRRGKRRREAVAGKVFFVFGSRGVV
ncbi:hypothetical protein HPP92_015057 [Vanilla planifolia]|uniref:Uncharacterized protein n=1 Tax=Vanilla planifolia TaxID=51239 RepID=A0A835UUR1_VANPL|nr:hypothetical protein HPP92_015057 [Vanilla planifolia]